MFSIGTVAKVCSVSRMCIIRMEEDGLVTPSFRNGDNGNRYYTTGKIFQIMQVLIYQSFGLTRKEILGMLKTDDGYQACLTKLDNMQSHLNRVAEEMHILYDESNEPRTALTEIPPRLFFTQERIIQLTYRDMMIFANETFQYALRKEMPIDWTGPMVIINRNPERMMGDKSPGQTGKIISCVPMAGSPDGPDILHHPGGSALTVCWRSETDDLQIGYQILRQETEKRGLHTSAVPSLILTSNQKDTNHFFRLVQPIEK